MKKHHYKTSVIWTGNTGSGTSGYTNYKRSHTIAKEGGAEIPGSSDPAFRGDATRFNPEDLLVSSVSSCHMLWYLHLCSDHNIIVLQYEDAPEGIMIESPEGGGKFEEVTLYPKVTIEGHARKDLALALHSQAHEKCFIARSCNFEIYIKPVLNCV